MFRDCDGWRLSITANPKYAWVILAISFLTVGITQGTRSAYGVFLEPLITEFGWDRAVAALPPAVALASFGLTQPFVGRLLDSWGVKQVIALGVLLLGLSTLSLVWATEVWQFVLFAGILTGIGAGGSSSLANSVLLSSWFERQRGLALGVGSAGISVGQAVLAPFLTMIIMTQGWRSGFEAIAFLLLAINLPVIWMFLKDAPSEASQTWPTSRDKGIKQKTPRKNLFQTNGSTRFWGEHGRLWRAGFSVSSFWWLNLGYFVCGFTDFFAYNHLVIYARDLGFSEMTGASAMSLIAVSGIIGTVTIGAWSDKTSSKMLLGWVYLSRAIGFILLGFLVTTPTTLFAFSFLAGLSFLATIPLTSVIVRELFGQRLMGTFYGIVSFSHQLGAAVGTFLGGLIFDISGSYAAAFSLGAGLLVLAAVLSFLIREAPASISETF